jgi:hypothetical protein
MAVPITSMNEDNLPELWKNEVGFAGKVRDV